MREFFIYFFRDDTFGPMIKLFGVTHILMLLTVAFLTFFIAYLYKNKDKKSKDKLLDVLICIITVLYFGDFFVHPLMENENILIVDKLPFHLCTSACILLGICRFFPKKLDSVSYVPTILGLAGGLMYISCPSGICDCYLLCYRSIQTIVYHSLFVIFGVLSMVFGRVQPTFRNFHKISILVAIQIVISLFANAVYSTSDHHYDWYYSTGTSFGINQYLMPFVMFAVVNIVCALIYGIYYLAIYIKTKQSIKYRESI